MKQLGSLVAFVVLAVLFAVIAVSSFLIDVGQGEMAILIRKTGEDIKNTDEVASSPEQKGVQKDVLTEGRHWRNPYDWEWEVIDQTVIPEGKLGMLVSLTGDNLPYGEFLAKLDDNGDPITKGIMPDVLNPGRYPINPYLFEIVEAEPVTVNAGFKGVVTNLAGPIPQNPNTLLVESGFRGVQPETKDPGTYYLNPFRERLTEVDCRSQRYNLSESGEMGFPSKDGFWVSLDGIIEFRVNPDKAAEVYVEYNDSGNGDRPDNGNRIDEEIIAKVIMPNARSFCRLEGSNKLGRDFIQGETRTKFQEDFQDAMREACEPLGIEIIQALITRIRPPQQIAGPVRDREVSKQEELQFAQQMAQQESEQKLAIEKAMVEQKKELVVADQQVVKLTTEALREQEVAVTQANQELAVAKLKLEAAQDEAAAIEARGKAEADVIRFENEAEAAGWVKAVSAFNGEGDSYAQYVLFQKLAPSYRQLMANTADSPIMKIFEMFVDQKPAAAKAAAKDAATAD